ncbi:hypothetical protein ACFL20_13645 [Spirochaetota bacterium]
MAINFKTKIITFKIFSFALLFTFSIINTGCLGAKTMPSLSEKEKLAIFNQTAQENLKKTLWEYGYTTVSNESRLDIFKDKITGIGGGYIGVGSIQNYTLAAWAKSEWIWFMDFTRIVVAANKVHLALIKSSKTSEEYILSWKRKSMKKVLELLNKVYKDDADLKKIIKAYKISRNVVEKRIKLVFFLAKKRNYKVWLNDESQYKWIRNLAVRGHIKVVKGDLNKNTTLIGIAKSARKMGIKIGIIYVSNAEEYFPKYVPSFRKNILEMPIDNKSIILRTMSIARYRYPWAPDSHYAIKNLGFHYNTMPLHVFKEWLKHGDSRLKLRYLLKKGKVKVYGKTGYSEVTEKPVLKKKKAGESKKS